MSISRLIYSYYNLILSIGLLKASINDNLLLADSEDVSLLSFEYIDASFEQWSLIAFVAQWLTRVARITVTTRSSVQIRPKAVVYIRFAILFP